MKIAKVATVIVTWNKLDYVASLLEDINKLHLDNIKLDIYVVDNASTDGTQAYIEQYYPKVKVLQTGSNLGGSGGFSHGLEVVSKLEYDYLWLLDNDVRLDTLALKPLVETFQIYPEIGLVGSQIRKLDEPNIIQEIGSLINPRKAHLKTNFGNCSINEIKKILPSQPYFTVDVCAAASLLVRREVVEQIGVFEDYFLHFDDVEWCLRAKKASWVVAANPASIVWHTSPDFKCRPWISYYDERNLCYCWQKHQPDFVLKRILVTVPRLIYYAATGRYFLAKVSIQGFQDFINGIHGKMPGTLPYKEYSLEEILTPSSRVMVQSNIYQDTHQGSILQRMEFDKKITLWLPPQNPVSRLCLWLLACFRKPVEVTIVNCLCPDLYALNMGKNVYYFTDSGYVHSSVNLVALMKAIAKTIIHIWHIYWQVRKLKLSK